VFVRVEQRGKNEERLIGAFIGFAFAAAGAVLALRRWKVSICR
jgi:hypothetical protein